MAAGLHWPPLAAIACLSACATAAAPDAPAVLVKPTAASRAELHAVVSKALHAKSLVLADDALTTDSVLTIERAPARDAAGVRLSGRDYDRPEQFQLWKIGNDCVLVQQRTSERWPLRNSRCVAVGAKR